MIEAFVHKLKNAFQWPKEKAKELSTEPQIFEVTSSSFLLEQLLFRSTSFKGKSAEQVFSDKDYTEQYALSNKKKRLENIYNRAKEIGYNVFLVTSGESIFVIVATDQSKVEEYGKAIQSIFSFAEALPLKSIPGMCVSIHNEATRQAVLDGSVRAAFTKGEYPEKEVYPVSGIHQVGWKSVDETAFIWTDFTAKEHIFHIKDKTAPLAQGLVVIEDTALDKKPMHELYQTGWKFVEEY
jgi:hypothetical protein